MSLALFCRCSIPPSPFVQRIFFSFIRPTESVVEILPTPSRQSFPSLHDPAPSVSQPSIDPLTFRRFLSIPAHELGKLPWTRLAVAGLPAGWQIALFTKKGNDNRWAAYQRQLGVRILIPQL